MQGNEVASLAHAVSVAVNELEPLAQKTGAALAGEVAGEVPVACPASLLHVVILNLVSNGLKFSAFIDRPAVRVRGYVEGEWGVLEVEDNGPGIPSELHGRIFEPFFRAPDAPAGGTGIGLATVKRIVDAYDGEIRVASGPGSGARFIVKFPLRRAPV